MTANTLAGIYAAVVTPVDDRGQISVERYTRHARWLLRQGCHGLGIFGTTSETQAFSVAERQAALEAFLAAGLPADRIILGVGCCARADTLALATHAAEHGVTNLLCLPPFFYKNNSDEGLVRAFGEIFDGLRGKDEVRLFLYHFPQVSQVPITRGVIVALVERYGERFAGIKDSSGDLDHTLGLVHEFPGLAIFAGADQHLLDVLKAGGAGTISAAANLNCRASREVFEAFSKGELETAEAGMTSVAAVRAALTKQPLIPGLKHVIADGQHDEVWNVLRPPLVPLSRAQGEALIAELDAAGYAYDPDLYTVASA